MPPSPAAMQYGESARDLASWADAQSSALAADYDGLTDEAVQALRDLLSWTWR